jgi:Transposase DDE domain.
MAGNLKFYSRAKKYVPLRRFKGNTRYFKKKTEIARDLIAKDVEDIKKLGVKKRIIVCTDCGYTSEKMVVFLRRFGASYILGIKGNTIIPLKGGKEDLNKYFSSKELGKRSIGGKGVYFAESTLNLKTFGQQRVFMVKPSDTSEPRFFITDIRKSKPETIMSIAKRRWDDEQGHKDLKKQE